MAELVQQDHRPFADLLPHGPVVGDPADGILLLQEPKNPRDAGLGCVWKVEPRNVGAIADAAVSQMAGVLQGLFRSLVPGTTIQVIMHMAPTDRVERWSEFRKDSPDQYSLNEFQEASLKEGLAHADGAKRWRLRETTTLMTARLSAPIPDTRRNDRGLSLFSSEKRLLRKMNRLTDTVVSRVVEELEELRLLCESVLDMARVGHRRLDCAGIHREIARLLQPWQRQTRGYDDEAPMREQVLSVPARTTERGTWVFGPDEAQPESDQEWEARVMSLQQAPPRTYPGMLSSLHTPGDAEPFAPWEALPDTPLTMVTQVGVPDQEDERSLLRQKRNFAYMQRNNLFGEEDPEKKQLREDLDAMMRDTTSYILHTRVHLVLWGRAGRSMASTFSVITQAGRRVGLEFMAEPVLGHQLFLQCLPLGLNLKYPKEQMLRRSRRIPALSAAHLLPLYGDYTGSETPAQLYLNPRGEAVCVDFFDRALPHTIVAGMSRSGKSFLVNHLIQQALPLGASVCILDRWASYDTISEVYKGEYVVIDLDRPLCFNPFKGDLGQEHKTFLVALIDQMASGVSGKDAAGFGTEQKAVCSQALQAFAEWHHENKPGEEPLAARLLQPAQGAAVRGRGDRARHRAAHRAVRRQGGVRRLRGRPERPRHDEQPDGVRAGRPGQGQGPAIGAASDPHVPPDAIHHQPEARQQRKYLILDEAWALLKQESAAAFLEEAARALARFRCCAMFMTQQVSDFDSPAAQAVKNNAGNYVLLQQNPEQIGIIADLFDLTEQERRLLSKVHRRDTWGEAFLWQPDGAGGIIRLVPDPFLRWLASQKPHERGAREKLKAELGGDLMAAVSQLAREYPLGMRQLAA